MSMLDKLTQSEPYRSAATIVRQTADDLASCEFPQYLSFDWSRLTDDQFMEAMRLVVSVSPITVAAAWPKVQMRLAGQDALLAQLLTETASQIKSVGQMSLLYLERAPLNIRLAIVMNLDPLPPNTARDENWWRQRVFALELFMSVLYQLDAAGRETLLRDHIEPTIARVNPVLLYRTVRRYIRTQRAHELNPKGDVGLWLERIARSWVENAGYEISTVKMEVHRNCPQACVLAGPHKFVHDRRYHPCILTEGDEVIFTPSGGMTLTTRRHFKVVAVCFIPVNEK